MSNEIALRADRLRILREENGLSQRELARRCGMAVSIVSKYENGESDPSSTYLKLMAEQLGVSTDYLLGVSDDRRRKSDDLKLSEEEWAVLDALRREGWPGVFRLGAERMAK